MGLIDLVHDVKVIIVYLPELVLAPGHLLSNMGDGREVAVSRTSLIFQKMYTDVVSRSHRKYSIHIVHYVTHSNSKAKTIISE